MPRFLYIAKSQPHKIIQGDIEAETKEEAVNKLNQMGYFPISLEPEELSLPAKRLFGLRKISGKDIVLFTRQLSNLIESGVNIVNGLSIIANQIPNKYLKAVLNDVSAKIKDGKSLSESLAAHPRLFSNFYNAMILSGEAGGNLEQSLKNLADFLEKDDDFKNSIRASLIYPAFIFSVGTLTVIVLLSFVIPRLVTLFTDMGQMLPLPTRILIGVSALFQNYLWFILTVIFIGIFLWQRLYQKPQSRITLDKLKLKVPVWSTVILKTDINCLMRSLSLLISSGIPLVSALNISSSLVENQILRSEVKKFKDEITNGLSLSRCLKGSKLFPAFVTNIVAIGEESGNLEKSLSRIADTYQRDVDRTLKTLAQLLEPAIILVMGLVVGFIVLSMLLPIFQINLIVR